MQTIQTTTYTLPAHWASALINDDYTGLEDEEEQQITDWLHAAQPGYCVGCSDSPEFCIDNDVGTLACDCLEFYFHAA